MVIFFTPYTYLFLSLYFLVITFIFSIRNFFLFWLFIEILILLFIGVSYTVFIHRYTQLIVYFLFQTLASFSIIVFYLFSLNYMVLVSLFFKLGIFPFFSWYINSLYRFPTFILFLSRTFHKLPPLYIFYLMFDYTYSSFVLIFCLLTLLIASIYMLFIKDLRYLIVVSSIGNNSFFVLSVITRNLVIFLLFYFTYFVTIYLLIRSFGNLASHSISLTASYPLFILGLFILLLNLASFPPIPTFFSKFLVFVNCIALYSDMYAFFLIIILLNVAIILSYVVVFFKYIINVYRSSSSLLLH